MRITLGIVLVGIAALCAPRVEAQHLSIAIEGGRVTMDARDVPVRQVLAELARIGGVTVVGSERLSARPVTLLLNAVPERQAFNILLRDVSGYLLAARSDADHGSSAFDRVLILPMSSRVGSIASSAAEPVEEEDAIEEEDAVEEDTVEEEEDAALAPQIQPQEQAPAVVDATTPPGFRRQSPAPNTEPRPATGRSFPTFPVPVGSGRPGDLVPVPPANPYGANTVELPQGPLLPGSAQQPR